MVEKTPPEGQSINRIFEQGTDAISFYSDFAQVFNTGHEIVLQFYETIPGTPAFDGKIQSVRTRLKATITVSHAHAKNIGNLLDKQIKDRKPSPGGKK